VRHATATSLYGVPSRQVILGGMIDSISLIEHPSGK